MLVPVLVVALSAVFSTPSQAAPSGEVEPNDSRATAQVLALPVDHTDEMGGTINKAGDVDFYAFELPARQVLRVTLQPYGTRTINPAISLHAPDGSTLDARVGNGWLLAGYARTAGRYYLRVAHTSPTAYGHHYGFEVSHSDYPPQQEGWRPTPVYPPQWYDMGTSGEYAGPSSAEISDIDGNGRGDVLISAYGATADGRPGLYVFPGRANGSLDQPRRWLLPAPPSEAPFIWMGVASGNLVGTAARDIAMGTNDGVQLFEQRDNDLVRGPLLRTPYAVNTVLVADMNRDGRNDIVAGTWRGVLVLRRTASGFAPPQRVVTLSQWHVRAANVTGDALPDLVGVRDDGYVRVYRQRADGTFAAPDMLMTHHPDFYPSLDGLVVADVTGDGARDVIADNNKYLNVFVRITGGWTKPRVMPHGNSTPIRQAGDLNGDGRLELIGSSDVYFFDSDGWLERTLFLNGDGGFGPDITALGDIDGDGDPDLATAGSEGPVVFRSGFTP